MNYAKGIASGTKGNNWEPKHGYLVSKCCVSSEIIHVAAIVSTSTITKGGFLHALCKVSGGTETNNNSGGRGWNSFFAITLQTGKFPMISTFPPGNSLVKHKANQSMLDATMLARRTGEVYVFITNMTCPGLEVYRTGFVPGILRLEINYY